MVPGGCARAPSCAGAALIRITAFLRILSATIRTAPTAGMALALLAIAFGPVPPARAASATATANGTTTAAEPPLVQALETYRHIVSSGGWRTVPDGPTLRMGDAGSRVAALIARLRTTGDLSTEGTPPASFDDTVEAAVRRFQQRHGLLVDGVVGKDTLVALNVPAADRVSTLALNVERTASAPEDGEHRYVLINIPAFQLRYVEHDRIVLTAPVVVGRPYMRTPEIRSAIRQVIFQPYWTIPVKIARNEIIPKVRKNPGYLARENIRVFDGWGPGAHALDPAAIDWRSPAVYSYKFRQEPGPENALGRVKFNFDNPYSVYLHDTPAKSLFERPVRAFSHGCIRVGKPLDLAKLVLSREPGWTPEAVAEAFNGDVQQTVDLTETVPIYVVYRTAWVDAQGRVNFRQDIYHRDHPAAVAAAGRVGGCPVPRQGA